MLKLVSHKNFSLGLASLALGCLLTSCILESKTANEKSGGANVRGDMALSAQGYGPPSPLPSCYRPPPRCRPPRPRPPSACVGRQTLLFEPWNSFNPSVWSGDGDQVVDGGYFYAQLGAFSAAADWIQQSTIPVDSSTFVRFSNRLLLSSVQQNDFAVSGALFFVSADTDGSYQNYVFLNVGYTLAPSRVFVEAFGATNGVEFDQFEETSLSYSPSQAFMLDLVIEPNAFRINAAGVAVDTVTLLSPITDISLFEVGVQQPLVGGLRGLVDQTSISTVCRGTPPHPPRNRPSCKGQMPIRVSPNCLTRNQLVQLAKSRLPNCPRPSAGMRVLANMRNNF